MSRVRVLRIIEHIYPDEETAIRKMAYFKCGGNGQAVHGNEIIRYATMPMERLPEGVILGIGPEFMRLSDNEANRG